MATVMITQRGGRTLMMIGLEADNVERIRDGNPFFHPGQAEYGFPLSAVDIVIFEGEPEDIIRQMQEEGIGAKRVLDLRKPR